MRVAIVPAGGYTGVGRIAIDSYRGEHDTASSALARHLAAHFRRGSR